VSQAPEWLAQAPEPVPPEQPEVSALFPVQPVKPEVQEQSPEQPA